MSKKLFGVFFGLCLVWGSTLAFAQCGSNIRFVTQNCGGHCGSVEMQICEGVGSFCQDGTGELGFGCCGLQLFEPGSCQFAKATQPKEIIAPSEEFLALQAAIAMHKKLFPRQNDIRIASCGVNQNAFNEWLETKLRQQQQQR
jgi:hypothetical protein